jgi:hypothetical protein
MKSQYVFAVSGMGIKYMPGKTTHDVCHMAIIMYSDSNDPEPVREHAKLWIKRMYPVNDGYFQHSVAVSNLYEEVQ